MVTLSRPWRSMLFVAFAAIAAAALADVLLYRAALGWTAGLFTAALLVLVLAHRPATLKRPAATLAGAGALLLALGMVESPTPLAIAMALLLLATFSILSTSQWTASIAEWMLRLITVPVTPAARALLDSGTIARWFWRHPNSRPRGLLLALRWVLPLFLGGVFVVLFTFANPILGDWAQRAGDQVWTWLQQWPELLRPGRMALWLLGIVLVVALLRPIRHKVFRSIAAPPRQASGVITASAVVRCLLVFNAIFAVQTVMDIAYLWAGAALPEGMTYAHYAHRGAYPLIATALLAALFVLVAFRRGGAAEVSPWARRLVFLWLAQNVLLMASTLWRIALYVEAYSLSRWRIAAMIWVGLVALGLLWIVLRLVLRRGNVWLIRANVATLLAVLYLCAFVNFDGIIAWYNVRHCQQTNPHSAVPLDLHYLNALGEEALPALEWVLPRLSHADQEHAVAIMNTLRVDLVGHLDDWRSWTWRRARLARQVTPASEEPSASAPFN